MKASVLIAKIERVKEGEKMKTNREDGDSVDGERDSKRQRIVVSSSSPSPSEEPLVPYNDDEDDERRALNHMGGGEEDGHRVESEEDDNDDDDPYGQGSILEKPNRQVEVRRDCPYLDTVNRQVNNFKC